MTRLLLVFLAIFFAAASINVLYGIDDDRGFTYVGSKVCGECHGEDSIGNQNKIWLSSPHAKAYYLLTNGKAAKIAEKRGISNPANDERCLKCHTTGKGRNPSIVKEGVGCEACHGPGSEYHRASRHVDYSNRENGYRTGVRYGMYPILGIKSLKKRERLCLSCHTTSRPCYPEVTENSFQYKIPIQTIDSLWKGDINFRHPLRR